MTSNAKIPQATDLEALYPSADELFGPRPSAPAITVALPPAWEADTIARELADRECARLIANCIFDPPITEEEIDQYARRCRISRADAESRIRSERRRPWES